MRIDSTDDVQVHVHDLGGDGPDLLLAHATGFHGRVWEPLAAALPGFRRWSVDQRAHGDSPLPPEVPLRWEGFADDLLATVDGLGLERPFGVGHSKGGAALILAEQRRPGTFRALFLFEPVILPPALRSTAPTADNPLSASARRRRPGFSSHDEAFENFAGKPPFSVLHPDALRAYVEHGFAATTEGVVLKCRPEHEAEVYAHGSVHDAFDHLDRVACPVTVVAGDADPMGPAGFAADIAAALPQGHFERIEGIGHFGPLQEPATVAFAIRRAFAGC